jgi:hypothetical protein
MIRTIERSFSESDSSSGKTKPTVRARSGASTMAPVQHIINLMHEGISPSFLPMPYTKAPPLEAGRLVGAGARALRFSGNFQSA